MHRGPIQGHDQCHNVDALIFAMRCKNNNLSGGVVFGCLNLVMCFWSS